MKRVLFLVAAMSLAGSLSALAKVKIAGVLVDGTDAHYLQYVRYMTVPFASQSGPTWDSGNNTTGKTPAEIQTIVNNIKALETVPRQKEIYNRMQSAPTEIFTFNDVAHAKGVVLARLETVRMMRSFNEQQNYTYTRLPAYPTSTTAASWEVGPRVAYYFRQKSGTPFSAIGDLCNPNSKTYGECLGAIKACVWWGASQGMGQTSFNSLHSTPLDMDKTSSSWSRNTSDPVDGNIHVPGDRVYFINFNYARVTKEPEFLKKGWIDASKIYFWAGENAIYCGENQYEGLGAGPYTEQQMKAEVAKAYNRDLAKVIEEVAKLGGFFNGVEVKKLPEDGSSSKVSIIHVKRVKY